MFRLIGVFHMVVWGPLQRSPPVKHYGRRRGRGPTPAGLELPASGLWQANMDVGSAVTSSLAAEGVVGAEGGAGGGAPESRMAGSSQKGDAGSAPQDSSAGVSAPGADAGASAGSSKQLESGAGSGAAEAAQEGAQAPAVGQQVVAGDTAATPPTSAASGAAAGGAPVSGSPPAGGSAPSKPSDQAPLVDGNAAAPEGQSASGVSAVAGSDAADVSTMSYAGASSAGGKGFRTGAGAGAGASAAAGPKPAPADSAVPEPGPLTAVLRGKVASAEPVNGAPSWEWSGQWFMYGNDKLTSAFRYSCVAAVPGAEGCVADGPPHALVLSGFFMLKNADGSETKIVEEGVRVNLATAGDSGNFKAVGDGTNGIVGAFSLNGSFEPSSGTMEMMKAYTRKGARARTKRASRGDRRPTPIRRPGGGLGASQVVTPRERAQRRRTKTPAVRGETMDEDSMAGCKALMRVLFDHELSPPFHMPVDPVLHNVPDYFDVITNPMDFSTIERNLNKHQYADLEGFAADVQLVFGNAMTYNKLENPVHQAALKLREVFEERLEQTKRSVAEAQRQRELRRKQREEAAARSREAQMREKMRKRAEREAMKASKSAEREREREAKRVLKEAQARHAAAAAAVAAAAGAAKKAKRAGAGGGEDVDALKAQLLANNEQLAAMQAQIAALTGVVSGSGVLSSVSDVFPGSTTKKKGRSRKRSNKQAPMTWDEKRELTKSLDQLPPENMERVLEIIRERQHLGEEDGQIEIDMDSLDDATLRALNDYVKSISVQKRPREDDGGEPPVSRQRVEDLQAQLGALDESGGFGDLLDAPIASDGTLKTPATGGGATAGAGGGSVGGVPAGVPPVVDDAANLFDDESSSDSEGGGDMF